MPEIYIKYIITAVFIFAAILFAIRIRSLWGGTLNLNMGMWNRLRENPEEILNMLDPNLKNKEEAIEVIKNIKKMIKTLKLSETITDVTIVNLENQEKTYRITMSASQNPQILSFKNIS